MILGRVTSTDTGAITGTFDLVVCCDREPSSSPTRLPLGAGSVSWRVFREPMVLASGGRALLMQVAHPLVAAAVVEHSTYEADPWRRLARTLGVMGKMVFGPPGQSERQARSLARLHATISGRALDGTSYSASEPDLLAWVWATLVDTALVAFESSRGRLNEADRERYYDEQKLIAFACGVPATSCPATMSDFDDFLRQSIAEDLQVTPGAKAIASAVLRPPFREPFGMLATPPFYLLTVGLLPESLRQRYELTWSPAHRELLGLWLLGSRCTSAVVPDPFRDLALTLLRPVTKLALAKRSRLSPGRAPARGRRTGAHPPGRDR